jgi:lipoic acid synthetase
VEAKPVVYNHNLETVPRLYRHVRPKARYQRSLELLSRVKQIDPAMATKSGIMVGLGETLDEVAATMADLRDHSVDLLTVGQYLQPDAKHLPVVRFWHPDEYAEIREIGHRLGFAHVEAGPFVRSSYHASAQSRAAQQATPRPSGPPSPGSGLTNTSTSPIPMVRATSPLDFFETV